MRGIRDIIMLLVGGLCFFNSANQEYIGINRIWAQTEACSPHQPQALSGKIVFQAETDEGSEIYAIQADGRQLVQLTHNVFADEHPRWSPDGKQIVFSSNRDGNYEIYVMNADGENQRRLTHQATDEKEPAWSPDGKQIVFTSYSRPEEFHLAVMKTDGTEVHRIAPAYEKGNWASWSPDGNVVAYAATRYNLAWGIQLLILDTASIKRISGSGDMQPAWSPDGQQIAYISKRNTSKSSVWVMTSDGSDKRNVLADKEVETLGPAWSPDGKYLVYAQARDRRDPNWELAVNAVDEQQHLKFAAYPLYGMAPDWHHGHISDEVVARKGILWPLRIIYETEYAPYTIGKYRYDPDALNEYALVANKNDTHGFLAYGPFTLFPAGKYRVKFRIKVSNYDKQESPLLRIDVAAKEGTLRLGQQELYGKDFQKKNRYQEFDISYVLEEPQNLEFRVLSFGAAIVWVDRITVTAKLSYRQ